VHTNGAGGNGSGSAHAADRRSEPAPEQVRELAEACVRYVERAIGIKLDYEPETLSILDHYVEQSRRAAAARPEDAAPAVVALVAHTAGAYLGEVVRRRYPAWWRIEGDDPAYWRIELEPVYLSFSPVQLIADALLHDRDQEADERLELEDVDRDAVAERLAELPEVPEEEFFAPSTRLEVIDIAVEAIRARRAGEAEGDAGDDALGPDDYQD
jgi:hypothetical protein